MRRLTLLIFAATLAAGCRNSCQRMCVYMADYAEDCGLSVPESQLDACFEEQSDADDLKACRQFGDPRTLREEWTCNDLEVYFR